MPFIADFHTHFYPCYDPKQALNFASENLARITPVGVRAEEVVRLLFVVDPSSVMTALESPPFSAQPACSPIIIVPGRQIVTRERLELLAYATSERIQDGLTIEDALAQVRSAGGIPALNWAPGKWFFNRGSIVQRLIDSHSPKDFLICDTTLRFYGWPMPKLMRRAKEMGYRIVTGSDPFPLKGEEHLIGTYGIYSPQTVDPQNLQGSLKQLLLGTPAELTVCGNRGSFPSVARRLLALRWGKKS